MGAPGAFRRPPAGFVKQIDPSPRHRLDLIPNFCEARPVLALAFLMAVVAAVLTLSSSAVGEPALQRWLLIRIHLQCDRQSVASGQSVSVRVDLGGRRHIKKKQ